MTVEGLNYVNNLMESLNIPYEFMEWTSDIPETYWIGEYQEIEPLNEDGMEECNFILTGNTKGSFLNLENVKELLKDTLGCDGETIAILLAFRALISRIRIQSCSPIWCRIS